MIQKILKDIFGGTFSKEEKQELRVDALENKWFSFSYLPEYKDGMYNIVNDSDKISLRKYKKLK